MPVKDKAVFAYIQRCHEFGLKREWLGKMFTIGPFNNGRIPAKQVRILGLKPSAKNAVICDYGGVNSEINMCYPSIILESPEAQADCAAA